MNRTNFRNQKVLKQYIHVQNILVLLIIIEDDAATYWSCLGFWSNAYRNCYMIPTNMVNVGYLP